ncbi:MAG TPA: DUF4124 domain-containing protein [Burkholderiales bacterium]
MFGRLSMAIFLIAATAPAAADTYKWLDANGVVNYSNAPPPETAAKAKRVGERISVVAPDPSLGPAVAAMNARAARRAQYEEADWQMRQRYLLAARASYPANAYAGAYGTGYDPYATPYYPVAYAPVFVAGAVRRFSPSPFFRHR